MPNPIFSFFEIVAEELCAQPSRVITGTTLQVDKDHALVFEELKDVTQKPTAEEAIHAAVEVLARHFDAKGSKLPFQYDPGTARFTAIDLDYLRFIKQMSSIRSIGTRSQEFELEVLEKLKGRVTGSLHRVGHPRQVKHTKAEFNAHLKEMLGFEKGVLLGADKDGGLDILWVLPLGSRPHRPLVSVQCKNGEFDIGDGDKSVNAGIRSLSQHGRLQAGVHVPCVLFNDYLYPEVVTEKAMNYVPLGLTDLSPLSRLLTFEAI